MVRERTKNTIKIAINAILSLGVFSTLLTLHLVIISYSDHKIKEKSSRSPASVVLLDNKDSVERDKMNVALKKVRLGCVDPNKNSKKINSPSKLLQLSGKICFDEMEERVALIETEIVNTTNNIRATLFYPKPNLFTSDLISLVKGENKLFISHKLKNGNKIVSELIVNHKTNGPKGK